MSALLPLMLLLGAHALPVVNAITLSLESTTRSSAVQIWTIKIGFHPNSVLESVRTLPQMHSLLPFWQFLAQKCHITCSSLRSVHPFLHSSPFYSTPQILCFAVFINWPDTSKTAASRGGIYMTTSSCCTFTGPICFKLLLDRSSHFCKGHNRMSLYFKMCVKMWLTDD